MRTWTIGRTAALLIFLFITAFPLLHHYSRAFIVDGNFSLKNYIAPLSESRQLFLLLRTLVLGLGALLWSLVLGAPFGLLIAKTDLPLKRVFTVASMAPLAIPPYIAAIGWIKLLGKRGLLSLCLAEIVSSSEPPFTIYGLGGTIFVLGLSYFPCISFLVACGLRSVDRRLEEVGMIQGSTAKVFKRILFPLVSPYLLLGATLVFIFSITNFGTPAILGVSTYTAEIFSYFEAFYDWAKAASGSIPLIFLVVIVIVGMSLWWRRRPKTTISGYFQTPRVFSLGHWRWVAFFYVSVVIGLSVGVPIIFLIVQAGSPADYIQAMLTAARQIRNSFMFALLGASAALVLVLPIARLLTKWNIFSKESLIGGVIFPFAIPSAILGIALIGFWNQPAFLGTIYRSPLIVVIAYVARLAPLALIVCTLSFDRIEPSLEQAAIIAGANGAKVLGKILLPLSQSGILASWIITFVFAMGELGSIVLIAPPGYETIPVRIFTLMHYGATSMVASLCITVIGIIVVTTSLIYAFLRSTFSSRSYY
jgi:iron(III) transport system permease protein